MSDTERFSNELLNAYVDDELDGEDRRRIEHAMEQDSELRERVEELERLKRLVRQAYIDEALQRAPAGLPPRWNTAVLAASLAAFTLGVALTWGWLSYFGGTAPARVASTPEVAPGQAINTEQGIKVVFHISRNDVDLMDQVLNEAEALLTTANPSAAVSVRIIASGAGLSLFERDSTLQVQRIRTMKQDYRDKLVFNGCGLAYQQLVSQQAESGFQLLPEVELVDLGVLELMRRQREGWAYIRI